MAAAADNSEATVVDGERSYFLVFVQLFEKHGIL
eukprot:SAG31_NODE_34343_length_334_cov_0.655319_1_plen_33_part_10